jgi:hypothetical protein
MQAALAQTGRDPLICAMPEGAAVVPSFAQLSEGLG